MEFIVIPIMGFAAFVQTVIGFGSGLIAMPLLIQAIGLETAAPAFALMGQVAGISIIMRYYKWFEFKEVRIVLVGGLIAIPAGIILAGIIDQQIAMAGLGIVTIGYAVMTLAEFKLKEIPKRWGVFFGMFSGLLHGAYNTGGPPLVIYATSRRWQPFTFKGNMQVMFFIMGVSVIAGHFLNGNMTEQAFLYFLLMIPGVALGQIVGFFLDRFIKPEPFRKGTLILLVILGLSLIF